MCMHGTTKNTSTKLKQYGKSNCAFDLFVEYLYYKTFYSFVSVALISFEAKRNTNKRCKLAACFLHLTMWLQC